jgi:hypothetical protein
VLLPQRVSPLLKKHRDIFSEGNAAHQVVCDSLLQIEMAVWRSFFEFELAGSGVTACLQIVMAFWRASNKKKTRPMAITICSGLSHRPDHSAE